MNGRFLCSLFLVALAVPSLSVAAEIDRASVECMECHAEIEGDFQHTGDTGHAVGVDYALAASKTPGLVKPARLASSVTLVEGRISCVTCHIPYDQSTHEAVAAERASSATDPMLSIDNAGSSLCIACHAK